MNWLVVGVDPGPTPGIVAIEGYAVNHPTASRVIQCDADSALYIVRMLVDGGFNCDRIVLAVERFVVGRRATRSRTPAAGATTRDMVGALRELAEDVSEFVDRPAGAVKPWATDARLAAAGLLDLTKGMPHARDAGRHSLYAAVHAGLMPDPLSKRAAAQ